MCAPAYTSIIALTQHTHTEGVSQEEVFHNKYVHLYIDFILTSIIHRTSKRSHINVYLGENNSMHYVICTPIFVMPIYNSTLVRSNAIVYKQQSKE